jgi:hypothetical protein
MAKRICLCVTLAALAGDISLQAQQEVQFKLAGQQIEGNVTVHNPVSGVAINGHFSPAILPDGTEVILAVWSVCVQPPAVPATPCSHQVAGLAPRSAVDVSPGGDAVELDFDTSTMLALITSSGPSAWRGSLRRHTGLFSRSVETMGETEVTDVLPGPTPDATWTLVQKTTGRRYDSTAIFSGVIGSDVVTSLVPNGALHTHGGGIAVVRTSTH